MTTPLQGKVALVTGASSGIGVELATGAADQVADPKPGHGVRQRGALGGAGGKAGEAHAGFLSWAARGGSGKKGLTRAW